MQNVLCLNLMTLTDFRQVIYLPTSAMDVYTILLDERRHCSFTGDITRICDKEGEAFALCEGLATGKNIVLERGHKIIWSFVYNEPGWPEGHESEAALVFTDEGLNKCRVDLYHTAVPELFAASLQRFWSDRYWEPLRYYIER